MPDRRHRYQIYEEDGKYQVYDTWYMPTPEDPHFILDTYETYEEADDRCNELNGKGTNKKEWGVK